MKTCSRIKRWLISISFRNKLVIFCLSYVLILMGLVYVIYVSKIASNVYARNLDNACYEVSMKSESLRASIILIEELSNQIYNNNSLNKSLEKEYLNVGNSAHVYIEMIYPILNGSNYMKTDIFEEITIYTDNSTFMIDDDTVKFVSDDIADSAWYKTVLEEGGNGQIMWSYEKDGGGNDVLVLYRNLNGFDGNSSGVLKIVSRKPYLMPVTGSATSLYNIIQTKDSPNLFPEIGTAEDAEIIQACIYDIKTDGDGYMNFSHENVEYIAIYNSFKSENSQYTWKSLSVVPVGDLVVEVNTLKKKAVMIITAISVFLVFGIIIFSYSFTKRITLLDQKANLVSQGDFSTRLDIKGADEIGRLGASMNKMLNYIDNLINQVYQNTIKMQSYQINQREMELKALQNQINPHFLYNTLNAMRYKATMEGNDDLGDMMISLSRMLHYNINYKRNVVTLKEELEHLENYLALIKARFEDAVEYHIDVHEQYYKAMLSKLTLQPVVENCIQHGKRPDMQVLRICIRAEERGGDLRIIISDNGRGMDEEKAEQINKGIDDISARDEGRHVGLENVHKRIRLLFGEGYGIKIQSEKGVGTQVTMTLAFREYDHEI